jgi:hypothetical protein
MLLPTVASACAPRDHVAAAVAALAALTREVQVFETTPAAAAAAGSSGTAGSKGSKTGTVLTELYVVVLCDTSSVKWHASLTCLYC